MLEINGLTKKYSNGRGISDVSFFVKEKEILGVLGTNGSGKSTTFKCLLRLHEFQQGSVQLNRVDLQNLPLTDFGYLPEEKALYGDERLGSFLTFICRLKGMKKEEIFNQIEYWLDRLDLEKYDNSRIAELSKGNQQKVQLICAIISNPKVLILDEPLTGLDVINAELFRNIIREQAEMGKIILLSSHQFEYIEDFFDRVLFLKDGQILLFDSVKKIKTEIPYRYLEFISHDRRDYYLRKEVLDQTVNGNRIRLKVENEKAAINLMNELLEQEERISMKIEMASLKDILLEKQLI